MGTKGDWYIRFRRRYGIHLRFGQSILQDTGGNVGIGTSSPDQRLTVNGELTSLAAARGTFSDERFGKPLRPLTPGLNAVNAVAAAAL